MTEKQKRGAPILATRAQLSSIFGRDPRTIARWLEEGLPVARPGRGGQPSLFDVGASVRWALAREVAALTPTGDKVSPAVEKALLDRARRAESEVRVQQRRGELLDAREVEKIWSSEIAAVRAIILASYTTHADRVHRAGVLEGVAGVERALKDLAYEVLRELANPDRAPQEVPS